VRRSVHNAFIWWVRGAPKEGSTLVWGREPGSIVVVVGAALDAGASSELVRAFAASTNVSALIQRT